MIRAVINFLVFTNIWIGLGASAMTIQTYVLLGLKPDIYVCLFVFFATKLTYTFQRYVKILKDERSSGERLEWMKENEILIISFIIADLCIAGYCLMEMNILALLYSLIPAALISFYYAWKVPLLKGLNLRDIPGIKIFLIAIVWTYLVTFIPIINLNLPITEVSYSLGAANFLFVLAITIPFDIRDIYLDEPDKKTIPQMAGINLSKYISLFILLISTMVYTWIISDFNLGLILTFLVCAFLILKSSPDKKDMFFSFLLDGTLILLPTLMIVSIYSKVYIQ